MSAISLYYKRKNVIFNIKLMFIIIFFFDDDFTESRITKTLYFEKKNEQEIFSFEIKNKPRKFLSILSLILDT